VTIVQAESGLWYAHARVDKYSADQEKWVLGKFPEQRRPQAFMFEDFRIKPEDGTAQAERNLLTTNGINRMLNLTIAGGGQALTNTATRLGVGNGAGTAAAGDTDLSASAGSTNRWFQVMDATYPSVATNVLTARATWASADGNFAWNEWGLDVGTPTVTASATVAALLFNHKTSAALGTKSTGSWVLTVTVTIT
jgi:hypothetical protein